MLKHISLPLRLRPVPVAVQAESAVCPVCGSVTTDVVGRLALRLVFQCARCRVAFYRNSALQHRP